MLFIPIYIEKYMRNIQKLKVPEISPYISHLYDFQTYTLEIIFNPPTYTSQKKYTYSKGF